MGEPSRRAPRQVAGTIAGTPPRCPGCAVRHRPGAARCRHCGLRLAGEDVARLRLVRQAIDDLEAEAERLLASVRGTVPAPERPVLAAAGERVGPPAPAASAASPVMVASPGAAARRRAGRHGARRPLRRPLVTGAGVAMIAAAVVLLLGPAHLVHIGPHPRLAAVPRPGSLPGPVRALDRTRADLAIVAAVLLALVTVVARGGRGHPWRMLVAVVAGLLLAGLGIGVIVAQGLSGSPTVPTAVPALVWAGTATVCALRDRIVPWVVAAEVGAGFGVGWLVIDRARGLQVGTGAALLALHMVIAGWAARRPRGRTDRLGLPWWTSIEACSLLSAAGWAAVALRGAGVAQTLPERSLAVAVVLWLTGGLVAVHATAPRRLPWALVGSLIVAAGVGYAVWL